MVKCSRSSWISNGTSMRRRTTGLTASRVILRRATVLALMPPIYGVPSRRQVPRQELVEPVDIVIVDAPEHVGKPSLRIDIVELGRVNERQHHSGALPTAIGAGEQPRLPPESNSAQLAFGSIVG